MLIKYDCRLQLIITDGRTSTLPRITWSAQIKLRFYHWTYEQDEREHKNSVPACGVALQGGNDLSALSGRKFRFNPTLVS